MFLGSVLRMPLRGMTEEDPAREIGEVYSEAANCPGPYPTGYGDIVKRCSLCSQALVYQVIDLMSWGSG